MLRISTIAESEHELTLKLEGQIVGPWVELLGQECRTLRAGATGRGLQLELSHVTYADPAGRQLLRELVAAGVALLSPSPMILESLHEDGTA